MEINLADSAFVMICSAMVFFMTPGLAFFYAGMVRRKNVLNTLMASFFLLWFSIIIVGDYRLFFVIW